jgi:hypothetical protein
MSQKQREQRQKEQNAARQAEKSRQKNIERASEYIAPSVRLLLFFLLVMSSNQFDFM